MTAPSQVGYDDVVRVWREADALPEIEHAWLFDHLMPIFGDPEGPVFEGWTHRLGRLQEGQPVGGVLAPGLRRVGP
ncbi:hypothetical protein ACFYTV_18535 [Streptomyces sp. NPDC004562]|uniref:hypothetical protein n=1 Tax=Streptomyces sp. NPDC004562 TaxID=3364703 RepID=UPI0036952602